MTSPPPSSPKTRTDFRAPNTIVLPRAIGMGMLVAAISGVFGAGAWTATLSQRVASLEGEQAQRFERIEDEFRNHRERGAHPVADTRINSLEKEVQRINAQSKDAEGRRASMQRALFSLCSEHKIDCSRF